MDSFTLLRDSWCRDLRARNKAPRTIQAYTESVDRFIAWCGAQGIAEPSAVTRHHIRHWLDDLLSEVSAQTTVRHYSGVRLWFKWLLAEHEVPTDPTDGIQQPAVPEKEVDVPSEDAVRALLKACAGTRFEDRRDEALIRVLMDSGVRCAEVVGLAVEDVDLDDQVLVVTGKGRRPRGVPIGNKTVAALDRYLRLRPKRKTADRPELWLGKGGPMTDSGVRQVLRRRCDQAGIERMHPHQLRHFYADQWLRAGGTEGGLMRTTGWKSRSMVDRYASSVAAARAREEHKRLSPGDRL